LKNLKSLMWFFLRPITSPNYLWSTSQIPNLPDVSYVHCDSDNANRSSVCVCGTVKTTSNSLNYIISQFTILPQHLQLPSQRRGSNNIELKHSMCEWLTKMPLKIKIRQWIKFLVLSSISVPNGTKVFSQMNSWQNWRTLNRRIELVVRSTIPETVQGRVQSKCSKVCVGDMLECKLWYGTLLTQVFIS
jgi:hypothetical protein